MEQMKARQDDDYRVMVATATARGDTVVSERPQLFVDITGMGLCDWYSNIRFTIPKVLHYTGRPIVTSPFIISERGSSREELTRMVGNDRHAWHNQHSLPVHLPTL
jgi:hypothetical protein